MLLPTLPYPQRLAVFPHIAASRGVLIPVQAAMVEIFLFPVRVRDENKLHPSTKCFAMHQPWQCTLLRTLQQHGQLAQQAASKLSPSERTATHGAGESWQACRAPAVLAHLVFRIIREGIGPKILSIIARCSRLSCV